MGAELQDCDQKSSANARVITQMNFSVMAWLPFKKYH